MLCSIPGPVSDLLLFPVDLVDLANVQFDILRNLEF